jgi:hypothetical protein
LLRATRCDARRRRLRSFGSAGILPAFLNLRFAGVLAFLFVQTEKQKSRLEAGATKE